MKLSVMQENLARGLGVVSRAVSNRSTLPVLANVLLKTEDGGRAGVLVASDAASGPSAGPLPAGARPAML